MTNSHSTAYLTLKKAAVGTKNSVKTIFYLCITKCFKLRSDAKFFNTFRYMTSSVSRQDEPGPAL